MFLDIAPWHWIFPTLGSAYLPTPGGYSIECSKMPTSVTSLPSTMPTQRLVFLHRLKKKELLKMVLWYPIVDRSQITIKSKQIQDFGLHVFRCGV